MSDEIKKVTEKEREAIEAALLERFESERPLAYGAAGNSPYSASSSVYGPAEARERGARVDFVAVCRSHNGSGRYKGRGRWHAVYVVALKEDGKFAACLAGDREATEIGASGFYVRPWAAQEAEDRTQGLGEVGLGAMADALAALGL